MMTGPDMMMGSWSFVHWIVFTVFVVLVLYPVGRILSRTGFSPFWSVLALIPFLNLIGLWALAFIDWPSGKNKTP